jgi:hypothetical protein
MLPAIIARSVHTLIHTLLLLQMGVWRLPRAEAANGEQHSGWLWHQEVSSLPFIWFCFLSSLYFSFFVFVVYLHVFYRFLFSFSVASWAAVTDCLPCVLQLWQHEGAVWQVQQGHWQHHAVGEFTAELYRTCVSPGSDWLATGWTTEGSEFEPL